MELKDKVALVTGGSRGIGRAVVEAFVREGAKVYFTYASNDAAAVETCQAAGLASDRAIRADVRDRASVKKALEAVGQAEGRIDVLVNNAGINKPTDFDAITDEDWDDIMAVNLKGPFVVTQEALPFLRKSPAGSVIQMGSVSGQYGGPRTAHYAASKAGLISLSQVIARFLAPDNIRSNTLAAGLVASEMAAGAMSNPAVKAAAESVLLKRMGTTAEIAEAAVFLASDRSSYVTGQTLNVNGGLYF
ncbi:SDR family NAD(P)-dependent oxidoreductase [Kordiimonas marina]|uniref:SDR family NAD(P)-dependent oxidoreductase n=1 Tax=Kordiimonas marina TaxID=2872312 RepID=UPI001FF50EE1|nr:3-oxoacyl-ACP reductase family protein [Kordiimonas marina]MCJ9430323.1 3-oxoacyl-ACP reductase FabG [Kordiimonas marina]